MADVFDTATYNAARPAIDVQIYDGKTTTHINEIVTSTVISGDVAQAYRKCEISIANTVNGLTQRFNFNLGYELRVYSGTTELFRGPLFVYNVDDRGEGTAVAYDYNFYLTRSSDSLRYEGVTATQIVKDIGHKFQIMIGDLADTGYVIPKHIYRNKTLYDMIIIALTETEKKNSRKFSIINREGRMTLIERKEQLTRIVLENGRTLLSSSYSKSNEERKTTVKLIGKSEELPLTGNAIATESVSAYGVMQHTEIIDEDLNQSQITTLAHKLLSEYDKTQEEIFIEALGLYNVISGTAIVVNDKMSNLYGAYYVNQDTHTFDASGLHTMALTVARTLDIPREDYEDPEAAEAEGGEESLTWDEANGGGGGLPPGDYVSGYVATAYDPLLGGINANGDPSNTATMTKPTAARTIAVDPLVIPYGSVVAIRVPSMPESSGIFLAEDTGGAIKGKRIDILIAGQGPAMKFGRRDVEVAILEKGGGPSDAREKAKNWATIRAKYKSAAVAGATAGAGNQTAGAKVVAGARQYLGKLKYSLGGNNIPGGVGDCSSYTQFIYQQYAGVALGRDTLTQIKKGAKLSGSDAIAGDLIFFQGTYRAGVSHVGIVTKPGYFINLAGQGCYEASYTSGYWAKHYMQIRRVL